MNESEIEAKSKKSKFPKWMYPVLVIAALYFLSEIIGMYSDKKVADAEVEANKAIEDVQKIGKEFRSNMNALSNSLDIGEMTDSLNKLCPKKINQKIRLDSVINPFQSNEIQFYYSLLKIDKSNSNITDLEQIYFQNESINMKANKDSNFIINKDASLNYFYYDKQGNYLFEFIIQYPKRIPSELEHNNTNGHFPPPNGTKIL